MHVRWIQICIGICLKLCSQLRKYTWIFSIKIQALCSEFMKMSKKKKKHHLTKMAWIRPFIRIQSKSLWGLFWTETNPLYKFCGNLFSSFCVILVTNQQTKKWTQRGYGVNTITSLITKPFPLQYIQGLCYYNLTWPASSSWRLMWANISRLWIYFAFKDCVC